MRTDDEIVPLLDVVQTAARTVVVAEETLYATLSSFSPDELMSWAMANGASEHDSRKLSKAAHEFLQSSAKSLRSASEVLELLGKIMKAVDDQTSKEDNDE